LAISGSQPVIDVIHLVNYENRYHSMPHLSSSRVLAGHCDLDTVTILLAPDRSG
jgi:hypothetical protein